jgi:UDP:flavonoid glycosyltransferase YjiC (YdhE family)
MGRALVDAGHQVAFVSSRSFSRVIEEVGFTAIPAGMDWLESQIEETFPEFGDPSSWAETPPTWTHVFEEATHAMVGELVQLIRDFRADLLVHESIEFGGPLAGAAAGIPFAALGNTARGISNGALFPYLHLVAFPPSMDTAPLSSFGPTVQPIRPVPLELADPVAPSWLADLPERPLVYVTMGTVFNRIPGPFETILEALSRLPVNAVVTVGPNVDLARFGQQPDHIHLEQYVSARSMLQHADVAINHAGSSSMLHALVEAVPILALPLGADQHYHAFRLAGNGAGLQLDPYQMTGDELSHAVELLLEDDLYRRNAQRLSAEIASMPAPAEAVPLLEELARRGPA